MIYIHTHIHRIAHRMWYIHIEFEPTHAECQSRYVIELFSEHVVDGNQTDQRTIAVRLETDAKKNGFNIQMKQTTRIIAACKRDGSSLSRQCVMCMILYMYEMFRYFTHNIRNWPDRIMKSMLLHEHATLLPFCHARTLNRLAPMLLESTIDSLK